MNKLTKKSLNQAWHKRQLANTCACVCAGLCARSMTCSVFVITNAQQGSSG